MNLTTSTPEMFEGKTWPSTSTGHTLNIEPTEKTDTAVDLRLGAQGDGPSIRLTPQQARELARTLVRRADLLDPPDRRWADVPRTPGEIIQASLLTGNAMAERVWDDSEPPIMTYVRNLAVVDSFTIVALMAELAAVAPERAAKVAELLGDAYDDGSTVHEQLWEWARDRASGLPIGFDPPATLPLADTPAEHRVLLLDQLGMLSYDPTAQTWLDLAGKPLPDVLQRAADKLAEAGHLTKMTKPGAA
ncbi:hypothetical protein Amir_5560 [Actinosynnema mirum DSM 43827]|uniref:Uncharacterized protein n=1 Tax=Actinosynnema mirum (strain ATCC 29888 / DSM 43827 / JCM 3225 / NBRC 14064 / NCIMB 13271 / NRRL B-12336 / IMRU 3971 / 101) TaxID=446462 RepID=C6WB87_ACTMD|nr:hypothetical protein Amir_5560 [Actinosynnema mirum DSM 43827]